MNKNDFFKKAHEIAEKVINGAEKQVDKAKETFDNVTEPIKLEWKIAEAKSGLDSLLMEYGKAMYYGSDNEEEINVITANITSKEDEIKALLAQLDEIKAKAKGKVYCAKCGAESKAKDEYCRKCGNNLKE